MMSKKIKQISKNDEALRLLLKTRGPLSAPNILKELQTSQPTLSRMLNEISDLLIVGEARSRVYAITRSAETYPIVEIQENGATRPLGELHLVAPRGAIFMPTKESKLKARIYEDIPFFIWDMRPQGYLGKIFISQHPELNLPERWEDWQESDLFRTLQVKGDDLVGNLIIGHESFHRLQADPHQVAILKATRAAEYPKLADEALRGTLVGSSAGGEQPKFTAAIEGKSSTSHVLVKFSPPTDSVIGRRWADLLVAEHTALHLLNDFGCKSAESEFFESQGIAFLEVERFDRVGQRGRKGLLSLGAVNDEYVGARNSWTKTALRLRELKIISREDAEQIIFLDCFGAAIANSDRHFGNLSLFWSFGKEKMSLAPVYDMLPMAYAPVQGNIVEREFKIPLVQFEQLSCWDGAKKLATEFWKKLSTDKRVSEGFRKMAKANALVLSGLQS
jgi:hypothetical protein